MAFTIDDFQDLLRLLRERPEWKAELRREILDEQFLALPALVRENSEMIARLGEEIRKLAEIQRQNEARFTRVEADIGTLKSDVGVLKTDVGVLKTDVGVLKVDVAVLKTDVGVLKTDVGALKTDVGVLKGDNTERAWREHFDGRFGRRLRRSRVVTAGDLPLFDAADEAGTITAEEALAVRRLDIIMQGVEGRGAEARDAILAVEVSATVGRDDVTRAAARAATLRRAGYNAYPAVAGSRIDKRAAELAREQGVDMFIAADGELPE